MKRIRNQVRSKCDGLNLDYVMILPEQVKGIIQISHGMCEHKERYIPFMEYLAEYHYASIIHDHRGHGRSVQQKEDFGYFYDDSGSYIVEDLYVVAQEIKKLYPDVPFFLFGHSMGSLVVQNYMQKYDNRLDGLIVCGAPCKNSFVGVGIQIVQWLEKIKGNRYRSTFVEKLSTGNFDHSFPGTLKNRWISANKENVLKYNEDPACGFRFTLNGYKNLFILLKQTYTKEGWVKKNLELPILFIAGQDDPVIGNEKVWKQAQKFIQEQGYMHVSGILFEGLRHEILNEKENRKVYDTILDFLEATYD